MITRRTFTAGLGGTLLAGLSGCVTHESGSIVVGDLPAGYKPDIKSDEAGLWLSCEKAEADTAEAGNRIRAKAINDLVADITCRIAPAHCPHMRTYVLRNGVANAFASPNGMIQVWSGMLLRMKTESELAAILGHEFAHYRRRHSLQQLRNIRMQGDLTAFLGMGVVAVGGTQQSLDLMKLMTVSNLQAFSRENEYEADALGLRYMADAGYDPFAAPAIWRRFMALQKVSGEEVEEYDYFLATHPSDKQREKKLTEQAEQWKRNGRNAPNRLREALVPIRADLLADEVNQGKFKQSMKLFDIMLEDDPAPGQILYYKGELHRRRARDGDDSMALGYYHEACEAAGAPPEAFRMVGLIRWRRGEKDPAREYFRRYLDRAPEASDREMIRFYLAGA